MEIIKDFISEEKHKQIKAMLIGNGAFPYYYRDSTADKEDKSYFMFNHALFFENQPTTNSSNILTIILPLLSKVKHEQLIRAKVNLYTKSVEPIITGFHIDQDEPHKVLLYSVNTNNGYTLFENGDKVPSVANQAVIFDGHLKHSSVTQTDENIRVNININYK